MSGVRRRAAFCALVIFAGLPAFAAKFMTRDVPVPSRCTPEVNQGLAALIASGAPRDVDNIMACGVATQKTYLQAGGRHGNHHVTVIAAPLPDGRMVNVQIVVNDALDGAVTAQTGDPVFAYGQGYIAHGEWAAGIHDVHCSTHSGMDNGWIAVAGVKMPESCPTR